MNVKEIDTLIGKKMSIYLNGNKKYSGYARELIIPEEDEETQEPVLVLEIKDRKKGTVDGFYVKDIESIELLD